MELNKKNQLLMGRAGFGVSTELYAHPRPVEELLPALFPQQEPEKIAVLAVGEEESYMPSAAKAMKAAGDTDELKAMRMNRREKIKDLNLAWLNEMVTGAWPLREKMSLFWHGHFATVVDNPLYEQELLHIIRTNALGSFRTLLFGVSKSAAMLQFLNNQQNRKQHPNENFAREVMELFTLGRGYYTEDDVKEAARAFTGWGFNGSGAFLFRERQHDDELKTVLGKTGRLTGDDVLDILLQQKQTSIFITQKIYRYFVSDEQVDEKRVQYLAGVLYKSNYDIAALLKEIFTADWFYSQATVGSKIKAPIELIAGYERTVPLKFDNPRVPLQLQRLLGQILFYPPNVAGWPGGRNWIDSSSLVIRMRLPEALYGSKELDLSLKEDPETGAMMMHEQPGKDSARFRVAKALADWGGFVAMWSQVPKEELANKLADYLISVPLTAAQLHEVAAFADKDTPEEYIRSLAILLMALPEYQLC